MTARPAAAGDDHWRQVAPTPSTRLDQYAVAKEKVTDAIRTYLDAAVELGKDDPSSTLELGRQALLNDVNVAVDRRLLTVPLTGVWAEMTRKDTQADRQADGV
jgi:hypothetical protein